MQATAVLGTSPRANTDYPSLPTSPWLRQEPGKTPTSFSEFFTPSATGRSRPPLKANAATVERAPKKAEADDIEAAIVRQHSADFKNRFEGRIEEAKTYLSSLSPEQLRNGAVVLDIDETVSDTSDYYRSDAYKAHGFNQADWNTWMSGAKDGTRTPKAMPGTVGFIHWLKEKGVPLYFVTGRSEKLREATQAELELLGVSPEDYAGLTMKPTAPAGQPSAKSYLYKQNARHEIENRTGLKFIASLGDQEGDIWGESIGRGFKLPNEVYDLSRIEGHPGAANKPQPETAAAMRGLPLGLAA